MLEVMGKVRSIAAEHILNTLDLLQLFLSQWLAIDTLDASVGIDSAPEPSEVLAVPFA